MFILKYVKSITFVEFLPQMKAEKILQEKITIHDNVQWMLNHQVLSIDGEERVESITVKDRKTAAEKKIPVKGVFIYVGLTPNTDVLEGQLELNERGYITTDENLQASIPGVFVAGDVRDKRLRQVATAVGDGAIAAVSAEHFIEELKGKGIQPGGGACHTLQTKTENLEKGIREARASGNADFFTQEFECQYCQLTRELLNELVGLSDKIALKNYDFVKDKPEVEKYGVDKIPAIVVEGERDHGIRFYGVPAGYEFNTLIEDIMDVSRASTDLTESTKEALQKLEKPIHIQVFITLTCPHCPRAVHMAHQMAIESEMVRGAW